MYGNKARTCMTYRYGLLPAPRGKDASEGIDIAVIHMQLRNDLWNRLVALEQVYQEKRQGFIAACASGYDDMDKAARKAVYQRNDVKSAMAVIEQDRRQAVKDACHASGLWWVNYEEVKNSYESARKRRGGVDLKFHSWHRVTGNLTVRWQHGLPVAAAFADSPLLRIAPVDSEAWTGEKRSVRRRLCQTTVSLRIASDDEHHPIWLTMSMVMHRPLPEGGLIRSASVLRERVGLDYRWALVLVVELPERSRAEDREQRAKAGVIAIDLGWRRLPEPLCRDCDQMRSQCRCPIRPDCCPRGPGSDIRVAALYDDTRQEGQLVLSDKDAKGVLRGLAQVDDLASIRDKLFNAAKADLAGWLRLNIPGLPWFSEISTLAQWRSPARLAILVLRWRDNRIASDEEIFARMEAWRQRDKHLLLWQYNLRDRVLKQRRELYRLFAAYVAKRYRRLVLEEFDLSKVALKENNPLFTAMRHHRVLVAPSELRLAIENACRREGVEVIKVPAQYTTQECSTCGVVYAFNAARDIIHQCVVCGAERDQDIGAAVILLRRATALFSQP